MKILSKGKDGGKESTVWGFWIIEIKSLFSIVLLCFENGSREAYHTHAFDCFSWVLSGKLTEFHKNGKVNTYLPSLLGFKTSKDTYHKVVSEGRTWVLSFRGPWKNTWKEYIPEKNQEITLTHGRKVI